MSLIDSREALAPEGPSSHSVERRFTDAELELLKQRYHDERMDHDDLEAWLVEDEYQWEHSDRYQRHYDCYHRMRDHEYLKRVSKDAVRLVELLRLRLDEDPFQGPKQSGSGQGLEVSEIAVFLGLSAAQVFDLAAELEIWRVEVEEAWVAIGNRHWLPEVDQVVRELRVRAREEKLVELNARPSRRGRLSSLATVGEESSVARAAPDFGADCLASRFLGLGARRTGGRRRCPRGLWRS